MTRLKERESILRIMETDFPSITLLTPLSAVEEIANNRFHVLPVIHGTTLLGMVRIVDAVRANRLVREAVVAGQADAVPNNRTSDVEKVLRRYPATLRPTHSMQGAAEILAGTNLLAIPVLDHQQNMLGMVHTTDLMQYLVACLRAVCCDGMIILVND